MTEPDFFYVDGGASIMDTSIPRWKYRDRMNTRRCVCRSAPWRNYRARSGDEERKDVALLMPDPITDKA